MADQVAQQMHKRTTRWKESKLSFMRDLTVQPSNAVLKRLPRMIYKWSSPREGMDSSHSVLFAKQMQ